MENFHSCQALLLTVSPDAKGICAGGAKYNFTGPQAFGVADSGDSVYAIKKHVFDDKDITFAELKEAMDANFGLPC